MVNIDDFIKRLETILDYYGLSASAFADKINVQRSSMSHLLSGRNKPSLDFVLKVVEVFPEVDLYWILIGTGNFPKSDEPKISNFVEPKIEPQTTSLFENEIPKNENTLFSTPSENVIFETGKNLDLQNTTEPKFQSETTNQNFTTQNIIQNFSNEEIEQIVIFYKNGSFKNYSKI